jgi:hypothetical protein
MRSPTQMRDRLLTVAATYRNAIRDGKPPTKAVAERLAVSHSEAANLVAKARRIPVGQGGLDSTTRGVAHAKVDTPD